jgi:hypothetical protein
MYNILKKLPHEIIYRSSQLGYYSFIKNAVNLEKTQNANLTDILAHCRDLPWIKEMSLGPYLTINDFQKKVPVTTYDFYHQHFLNLKQKPHQSISRFQPTSGSSSEMKWIPYTQKFLQELNIAITPWMYDFYQTYPQAKSGSHYWSLSWVPQDIQKMNNDLDLMNPILKTLLSPIMLISNKDMQTETLQEAQIKTLVKLLSDPSLSFISIWSPTFLLSLIQLFSKHELEILRLIPIEQTRLIDRFGFTRALPYLFPRLVAISTWMDGPSEFYANQLQKLFPHAKVITKGLIATEGVVTIPIQNQKVLSYQSHFYEFKNLDTDEIHLSHELQKGMQVCPLLTTGSGLIRYNLGDRLVVNGFFHGIPCFDFIDRLNTIDLVGEKLSEILVDEYFKKIKDAHPIFLIGVKSSIPFYVLYTTNEIKQEEAEKPLMEIFHYRLARELGQLSPLKIVQDPQIFQRFQNFKLKKGIILGNLKLQNSLLLTEEDLGALING